MPAPTASPPKVLAADASSQIGSAQIESAPVPSKGGFLSPSSLRRITTSGGYIPEIDGLRFVAIVVVVLYHVPIQIAIRAQVEAASSPFWHLISNGRRGVELFFLISGFILGLPFAAHLLKGKKAVRLGPYYLRRVTRLEPPYMLVILLRLPLLIVLMHMPLRDVLLHGAASLFYMHGLIFGRMSTVSPPTWSLEVEIQFYCLAPLFAWSYFSLRPVWLRRLAGLFFILGAGVLQTHFLPAGQDSRATLSILNYVQYFFSGFMLCDLFLEDWNRLPIHWAWDVVSVLAWCWIFLAEGDQVHILLPLVTLVAYIGAFKGVLFRAFFRATWVSLVGGNVL